MSKQINFKNYLKSITVKKDTRVIDETIVIDEETTEYVREISNNKIINNKKHKEVKKSYTDLVNKVDNKANDTEVKCDEKIIYDLFDNYEKQFDLISKLNNNVLFDERKYFIQEIKKKHQSYKQQDIKKDYHEYNNFITFLNIIEKLVSSNMKCYYCNCNTLILFKNAREDSQWTLDRLNNYDEHSNENTIICCLKCNLQRRRKNSEKFKFSKQLEHNLLVLKKIDS